MLLWPRRLVLVIAAIMACLSVRSDSLASPRSPMRRLPAITLWAWDRPADLRPIDPARFAVAYLDQTLTIDLAVHAEPRRDPVIFPASAVRIPVVRIETRPPALLNAETQGRAVQAILVSARAPGIAALQIDFDATLSQRSWYRALLIDLRRQMPRDLPLSITALASWCSFDDWLPGLPIDEAVPMDFRMEPDRSHAPADLDHFRVREPLCGDSLGVSTGERWPRSIAGKRVYIFSDHGWRADLNARLEARLP